MSEPQPLGDYIRERRLALGFSAGQLAMRLRSTAAVVRTWERGHEPIPDDAFAGLADLLGVPEADLRAMQPESEADDESDVADTKTVPAAVATLESETIAAEAAARESSDAPADEALPAAAEAVEVHEEVDEAESEPSDDAESDHEAGDDADTEDEQAEDGDDVAAVGVVEDDDTGDEEPPAEPSENGRSNGAARAVTPPMPVDTGLLEAPTEAIEPVRGLAAATATRLRRRTAAPATASDPAPDPNRPPEVEPAATEVDGTVPNWLGPVKVLFDPSKPYIYWARWIGTFIGLVILFRVLGWSLGELVDSIGDFWDSFRTPEGPEGETIETLSWFRSGS